MTGNASRASPPLLPRQSRQQRGHQACRAGRRPSQSVTRSTLVLLVAAVLFAALSASTPAEARTPQQAAPAPSTAVTTAYASHALCPRCPLCSRPHTPIKLRLQYCHTASSYVFSLFSWGSSALTGGLHGSGGSGTAASGGGSKREQRQRYPLELPFATDDAVRRQCMRDVQDLLLSRVRGQPQVVTPLLDVLRRKLAYPREPVVVHLAGDNGVGKTLTARLVSQALSLRCATDRDVCDAGDNLLTIAGTGFDGLTVAEARRRIVAQVMSHLERFPHGVVLVDDLTAMDPALVTALAPLFGRARHFPEQLVRAARHTTARAKSKTPGSAADGAGGGGGAAGAAAGAAAEAPDVLDVTAAPPLSQLLVFITTDFGRQGRTVGKSRAEIEAMIQHDFATLYGALLPAHTRTFVYYPFTLATAEEVVRSAVADLPCAVGEHLLATSTISDEAVAFLVHQSQQLWSGKENGHALRRLVEDELVSQLIVYWENAQESPAHAAAQPQRLNARFELDERTVSIVLRTPASATGGAAVGREAPGAARYAEGDAAGEDDREEEEGAGDL